MIHKGYHIRSQIKFLWYNRSVGDEIKAYAGFGGFIGNHRVCKTEFWNDEEDCENDFTGGLYPEVGVIFKLNKVSMGIYGRLYKTFSSGKNEYQMYGFRLGYVL